MSSKQCIVAPQNNWAKKTKKNCRGPGPWPSAKGFFAEGRALGPRQRRFIKNKILAEKLVQKKSLPRAWSRALGKDLKKIAAKDGFTEKKTFAEGLTGGPRQSLTGNGRRDPTGLICRGHLCRGPVFAEGRSLPRAPVAGPRQILKPSAKHAFPVVCPLDSGHRHRLSGLHSFNCTRLCLDSSG